MNTGHWIVSFGLRTQESQKEMVLRVLGMRLHVKVATTSDISLSDYSVLKTQSVHTMRKGVQYEKAQ